MMSILGIKQKNQLVRDFLDVGPFSYCTDRKGIAYVDAIIELFSGVNRLAPGSKETTVKAFRIATENRQVATIYEVGCGNGAATLPLAELSEAHITAIDTCQEFLDWLAERIATAGLSERVSLRNQDMKQGWPEGTQFDLIWCEGSVYHMGLEQALTAWKKLLPSGGRIAVSDLVWSTRTPDQTIQDFWKEEGVTLVHREEAEARFATHGYRLLDSFAYPQADWDNYYRPLIELLYPYVEPFPASGDMRALAMGFQKEIRMRSEFGGQYDYVFFVAEV